MKKTILFTLLLYSNFLPAQQNTDSLLRLLNGHTIEDTIRLNILNVIAYEYHNVDPEQGILYSDKAIKLAKKLNYPEKLASAYSNKGTNFYYSGEDSMALLVFDSALFIHRLLGNEIGIGRVLHNIGLVFHDKSEFDKAIASEMQALNIFERINDTAKIITVQNSIGVNYMSMSDYSHALDFYYKSLQLGEKSGNKLNTANVFQNIGIINKNLLKYDQALEYYTKALITFNQLNYKIGIANSLANIATVYDYTKKPELALANYIKALAICYEIGFSKGIANNLLNVGIQYSGISNYKKAYEYILKAKEKYIEIEDNASLSVAFNEIAIIIKKCPASFLIEIGINPSNRYNEALSYHEKSLELARKSGSPEKQYAALENISEIYELKKEYEKSLSTYKQYIQLRDSIITDEAKSELTRKEMQFEFDKKQAFVQAENDKQKEIIKAEIARQQIIKNSTIAGASVLLLASVISFIFYKRKRDSDSQKKESDFKVEVSETEMKALRSQMNPHFIFNSLNSINDFISKNDLKTADTYLTKFSKVMRMILENSEQKEITLSDDLKVLELYMQLESLRLKNKFIYEIIIDEAIDKENTLIPPLILQPFVENSIWHGISRKEGVGKILIQITKEGQMINCIVEDNGIGRIKSREVFPEQNKLDKNSLGMKITKSRIDIINKIKNTNATIELSDLSQGLRVEVRLPLQLSF